LNGVEDLAKASRIQSAPRDIEVRQTEDIEIPPEPELRRFAHAEIARTEKPQLRNHGPRWMFRPPLPKVDGLGVLKAEDYTRYCGVCLLA
jgi:hypothetical protein